jgi:hypothetical protein
MSADNGIYILESKDGFRVIHAQAIENLYWWWKDERLYDDKWVEAQKKAGVENPYKGMGESKDKLNPKELVRYFGKCEVFDTKQQALDEAQKKYNEIMKSEFPVIEYGISFIRGWEDKMFPGCKKLTTEFDISCPICRHSFKANHKNISVLGFSIIGSIVLIKCPNCGHEQEL